MHYKHCNANVLFALSVALARCDSWLSLNSRWIQLQCARSISCRLQTTHACTHANAFVGNWLPHNQHLIYIHGLALSARNLSATPPIMLLTLAKCHAGSCYCCLYSAEITFCQASPFSMASPSFQSRHPATNDGGERSEVYYISQIP